MGNVDVQKRIKRRRRRFRFFFFLIIISIAIIFLFKTPVFKVRKVMVRGNNIVSGEKLIELSGVNSGDNVLKLNIRQINENILTNPYIETSKVKRNIFGEVYIDVNERQSAGVSVFGKKYVTFDIKGVIIEIMDSKEGINLPQIEGFDIKSAVPGKTMELWDGRKLDAFAIILNNITNSGLSDIIDEIELENLISIVLKTKYNINIKIGTIEDIEQKIRISKIIMDEDVCKKGLKGTIDVSFNGNPVFKQELN